MKKYLPIFVTLLIPAFFTMLALKYEMGKRKDYALAFDTQRLFNVCIAGTKESNTTALSKEKTQAICSCFAKALLSQQRTNFASIISDTSLIHLTLEDCRNRTLGR